MAAARKAQIESRDHEEVRKADEVTKPRTLEQCRVSSGTTSKVTRWPRRNVVKFEIVTESRFNCITLIGE